MTLNSAPAPKKARGPVVGRLPARCSLLLDRVNATLKTLRGWGTTNPNVVVAVEALAAAASALPDAVTACKTLVEQGFVPTKARVAVAASAKLEPGASVAIRAEYRAEYLPLVESDAVLSNLKVASKTGKRIVVLAPDGSKFFVAAKHLA